jgi:hypothetical protein
MSSSVNLIDVAMSIWLRYLYLAATLDFVIWRICDSPIASFQKSFAYKDWIGTSVQRKPKETR